MIGKMSLAAALLIAGACGSSTPPATDSTQRAGVELSDAELSKLDPQLRERLASSDREFPVRVKFARWPSSSDLAALLLVRYERVAIGRVDRVTLRAIAAREDVERISYVTGTGYGPDEAITDL